MWVGVVSECMRVDEGRKERQMDEQTNLLPEPPDISWAMPMMAVPCPPPDDKMLPDRCSACCVGSNSSDAR